MMWGLGYLVVCVTLAISVNCQEELLAVATIYRHGDRTPIYTYPTDPYDASYWPIGYGQLTNEGKTKAYNTGKWLRIRYSHFLSQTYNRSDIYARSTDVDRCLLSAQCLLAGLYPPKGDQIWNPLINWQPIPVHTIPQVSDGFGSLNCPTAMNAVPDVTRTEPFRSIWQEHLEIVRIAEAGAGREYAHMVQLLTLYDTLRGNKEFELPLPDWAEPIYDNLANISRFAFAATAWTDQQKTITAGPTLNEIHKLFAQALSDTTENKQKLWMLSAHDGNIVAMLNTLGLYNYELPPYSAMLMFELRSDGENNYVDISYKRDNQVDRLVLESCGGCDGRCTLEAFINATADYVTDEAGWMSLCH